MRRGKKTKLARTDVIPRTFEDRLLLSKLESCIKMDRYTHHSQHRRQKEGRENLELEGVIWPLPFDSIEVNFGFLKFTSPLSCRVRSVEFSESLTCVASLVKHVAFPF